MFVLAVGDGAGEGVWFMTLKCSVVGLRRLVGMRFHGYCSISV